ncbi:MAG: nuclear transport factor 2 family protein [Bacteroidales bacterium]
MKSKGLFFSALVLTLIIHGWVIGQTDISEKEKVSRVVHNSIGWALDKDLDLLYGCFVQDSSFFIFHPDSAGTIIGFESFKNLAERVFMNDAFKATGYEIRDLKTQISRSGTTAWFSCNLDDFGEWNGQPSAWINARWTGVLEKIGGKWLIAQMHFSFPIDRN